MINVDNSGSKSLDEIRDLAKQLGIDYNTKTTKKRLVELIQGEKPDLLKDQKCFKWAVLSCLHPADDHPYRLTNYTAYADELDDEGVNYPVKIPDVQKLAIENKLVINVFGWEYEKLDILHTDSRLYREDLTIVNLLWYNEHFMWIKSMSALLYKQTDQTAGGKHSCLRCLHHFGSERT